MCVQVFVQSAYMEWHTERSDKVPRNIFELGFKAFGTQPDFLAAYVSFLLSQGDVDNARQLFERSLAEPKPPLAIWDAYVQVCTARCRRWQHAQERPNFNGRPFAHPEIVHSQRQWLCTLGPAVPPGNLLNLFWGWQFESEHGTLASLGSVEQRRREAAGEARAASDALHVMLLEHRCTLYSGAVLAPSSMLLLALC